MHPAINPIFIVGAGRSGTTLLRLILNNHPHIAIPTESQVLINYYKFLPIFGHLKTQHQLKQFAQFFMEHPRIQAWNLDSKEILSSINNQNFSELIDLIYNNYAHQHHKIRWGEKTPAYITQVPLLNQLFPNSFFIHIIRDGRDVVSSQIRSFARKHFYTSTIYWKKIIQLDIEYKKQFSNYLSLYFEDLVQNPEKILQIICDFIQEPYDSRMLNYYESDAAQNISIQKQHHINTKKNILKNPIGVYKNRLTPIQIQLIETLCHNELKMHHYTLDHNEKISLSKYRIWTYKISAFYKRYIDYRIKIALKRMVSKHALFFLKYTYYRICCFFLKKP